MTKTSEQNINVSKNQGLAIGPAIRLPTKRKDPALEIMKKAKNKF